MILLMGLLPGIAWAGLTSNDVVQKVECRLLNDGIVLKEHDAYMMNIVIDKEYGKFIQIQFGDENLPIQYQLLIENDPESPVSGSLIFLQNLKVGEREATQEFSGQQVNWVRTTNEGYMVQCNLPEPIK
ncbi:branched-chain amino acid aminotransferase [Bdellovibrio bacteriovorus]|uniref:branched-chain amino acid aminotransferase n=1 Tax=Bdellovibrio bacteriovorus TaxID=959 RepID=UPI0035A61616